MQNFDRPPALTGNLITDVKAIWTFLFRLVDALNVAVAEMETKSE